MGPSSPKKIKDFVKHRQPNRGGSYFGYIRYPIVARNEIFDLDEYLIYYLRAVKFLRQIYSLFNAKVAPINV